MRSTIPILIQGKRSYDIENKLISEYPLAIIFFLIHLNIDSELKLMNVSIFFNINDINISIDIMNRAGGHGCIYSLVCKRWLILINRSPISRKIDTILRSGEIKLYKSLFSCDPPVRKTYLLHPNYFSHYYLLDDRRFLNCVKHRNSINVRLMLDQGYKLSGEKPLAIITAIRGRSLPMIIVIKSLPIFAPYGRMIFEELMMTDDIKVIFHFLHDNFSWIDSKWSSPLIFRYLSYENIKKFHNKFRLIFTNCDDDTMYEVQKRGDPLIIDHFTTLLRQ